MNAIKNAAVLAILASVTSPQVAQVARSDALPDSESAPGSVFATSSPPTCAPLSSSMTVWLPFETNLPAASPGTGVSFLGDPFYDDAVVGQGLSCGSIHATVEVQNPADTDLGAADGFSIEFWFESYSSNLLQVIARWNQPSDPDFRVMLEHGYIVARLVDEAGTETALKSPVPTFPGEFHHAALTYDRIAGLGRLYIDGTEAISTNADLLRPATRGELSIGTPGFMSFGGRQEYEFSGLLDEITLYKRSLSPGEILQIYEAGDGGKCASGVSPMIRQHPESVEIFEGQSALFTSVVDGDLLLQYQWLFDGNPLPAENSPTLTIAPADTRHSGKYALHSFNPSGSVTSAPAVLTVHPIPPCTPAPAGLISRWRFNDDTVDSTGTNHAQPHGDPAFVNGIRDLAVWFDGVDDSLEIPASPTLDVGSGGGMTIECWFKPKSVNERQLLFTWVEGARIWLAEKRPGEVSMVVPRSPSPAAELFSGPDVVVAGAFQHLAITYDRPSGWSRIFRNGVEVAAARWGSFTYNTTQQLFVNETPNGVFPRFAGAIDELALYDRALLPSEIDSIVQTGFGGTCTNPTPPTILLHPHDLTLRAGQTTEFAVVASGEAPIQVQWYYDGAPLADQTNAQLRLPLVDGDTTGNYRAVVSNPLGAATSAVAQLVLDDSPCMPVLSDWTAWWPLDGDGRDEVGLHPGQWEGAPAITNGINGLAVHLDGFDDAFTIPPISGLNPTSNINGFTIEFWMNPPSVEYAPILVWHQPNLRSPPLALFVAPESMGQLQVIAQDLEFRTPAQTLVPGRFQHVALAYDRPSGWLRLYHDGVERGAIMTGDITNLPPAGPIVLGTGPGLEVEDEGDPKMKPPPDAWFAGVLDELTVYARALAPSEIASIFLAGIAGKCPIGTRIESISRLATGELRIVVSAAAGWNHFVEASEHADLWVQLGPAAEAGDGRFLFEDTAPLPTQRFYRVYSVRPQE